MTAYFKGQPIFGFGGSSGDGGGADTAGEVYSTEETRIGTWIDGRPIYRRVFQITTPSTLNANTRVYTGFNDLQEVTSFRCIVHQPVDSKRTAFSQFNLPKVGDYESSTCYVQSNGGIYMRVGRDLYAGIPAVVIVEYTKTTD